MKEKAVEVISLAVYPDGSSALKDVRFRTNKAGKSTPLLHRYGILRGQGRVRIYGEEAKEKNLKKILACSSRKVRLNEGHRRP
ncbi:MAG: hypothetical protein ACUVV5_03885 [Candidatus Aminicenantales bacterium]